MLGRHGEKYLSIFFDETSNYIHVELLVDKSGPALARATTSAINFFRQHGSTTTVLRLDNEISESVRQVLKNNNISIDLTPVGQHRRNKAERAIRTYKNHHVATVAGFDKDCPLELWSDAVDQIELTINLLRTSPLGSSAWAAVHGQFDFNKTPIAPLGIKVVAHVPADRRAKWDHHGEVGFYIGRAPEHYRCYQVWIPKTKAVRISDCLAWFPAATLPVNASDTPTTQPVTPPVGTTKGGKERVVTAPVVPSPPSSQPVKGGKERVVTLPPV